MRSHLPIAHLTKEETSIYISRFATGSYDRTAKIWDSESGLELFTLGGHKNVVYSVAFNNPFGDKLITGSFDKTAKVHS